MASAIGAHGYLSFQISSFPVLTKPYSLTYKLSKPDTYFFIILVIECTRFCLRHISSTIISFSLTHLCNSQFSTNWDKILDFLQWFVEEEKNQLSVSLHRWKTILHSWTHTTEEQFKSENWFKNFVINYINLSWQIRKRLNGNFAKEILERQ